MALLARLVFLGLASAEVSRLESWHDIAGAASAGAGGTVVVPYVEVVPGAGWAEVPPNASVAIGSAGGATVNGTGASRFFVVRGELALSNLTLVDGYNGSYGGGVAVGRAGTLVLRNVSMSGCVSAFGGAVYALGALYVAGGTFSRNVAARSTPEVDGTGGFGDVFYAAGPTHVDGSMFLDNGVDDGLGYGWDHARRVGQHRRRARRARRRAQHQRQDRRRRRRRARQGPDRVVPGHRERRRLGGARPQVRPRDRASSGRGRRARARGGPRTRGGPGAPGQRPAVAPEDGPSQVFSSVDDEELATFAGGDEEPFFAGCCGTAGRRRRVLRRPPARGAARVSRGQLSDL